MVNIMSEPKIGRPKKFKDGETVCVRMDKAYKEYLSHCAHNESIRLNENINLSLLIRKAVEKLYPNNGTADMFVGNS